MKLYQNDNHKHQSVCCREKWSRKVLKHSAMSIKAHILNLWYAFSTFLCTGMMLYSSLKDT